ncbi:ADP-ribosyl-[dinitrogen reductase] hydrolase [Natronospira proteinivora]|uniref:ADP-ribosyl-[dinitrogen reductase] hydrolase n=1 Tax=Natronospira proteinivora TaxID=1807133 RepID=A0ABT1G6F6_9GAMM|nr:protein-tyrosine phosphatase family protein [Natronospira proteinivora]MCP1726887.1 ADP-ribosyl-[dinitrogen reductase] hydrolase [Natronospira proteinivora]
MYLSIDSLPMPALKGVLGLSRCPGTGDLIMSTGHRRLHDDLRAISDWGAVGLLTLNEQTELSWLGLSDLPSQAHAMGLAWWHCPIPDFCAPGRAFESAWQSAGQAIWEELAAGHRITIHCLAGLGRTGTVAARLLIEQGVEPETAIRQVRQARPGAIQSEDQFKYLMAQKWK